MKKNNLLIIFRLLLTVFILVILFFSLKYTLIYLYPFIIAFLIAIFLHPVVTFFETRWKLSRTTATLFTISSIVFLLTVIIFFIGIYILEEMIIILQTLPTSVNKLLIVGEKLIDQAISFFNKHILSRFHSLPESQQSVIMTYVQKLITQLSNWVTLFFNSILNYVTHLLTSLSYVMTIILFIVISLFFIVKDFNTIRNFLNKYIPSSFLNKSKQIATYFKQAIFGFIKAQIILTFITSIIIFTSFIILKIDHALTIAIFSFFIDFIPYAGVGFIFIPWILYSFFANQLTLTIQLAILYIIIIVVRQLIEPKILAQSIGIHPIVALIVLFISIKVWGMFGLIISPVMLMIISTMKHSRLFYMIWHYIKG